MPAKSAGSGSGGKVLGGKLWAKKRMGVTAEGSVAANFSIVPKDQETRQMIGTQAAWCGALWWG